MTAHLSSQRPEPGTALVFRWRKWDGSPHWEHECVFLGSDEWGDWFGQASGMRSTRPGRDFTVDHDNITLLPPSGQWVFTSNRAPHPTRVYIDVAWDARWNERGEPVGIDMDLDVVDRIDRGTYIDDEDEWAEHRVAMGYPLDVVAELERVAVDLLSRVRAHEAPFDDATVARWLDRLAALASAEPA